MGSLSPKTKQSVEPNAEAYSSIIETFVSLHTKQLKEGTQKMSATLTIARLIPEC
jgi:hypothetical protein